MTTQNIALFKALGAKMSYLDQRQKVLAQNIANADTPDYQPQDLKEVNFGRVLRNVVNSPSVDPVTTNARHMPTPGEIEPPKQNKQRHTYDVEPAGNAVVLEEQMTKISRNVMDYNLMTSLYQKHVSMYRMALGSGGQ